MSAAMHTPGPWAIEHTDDDSTLIVPNTFPADGIIATVNRAWPEYDDNASLIAAAPAMYKAFHSLIQFLVENDERWLDNQYVLDAQQALAQAEGK